MNWLVSSILLLLLNLLAYSCKKIAVAISIIGGTTQIYLMFVIPVMMDIKSKSKKQGGISEIRTASYLAIVLAFITIGLVYTILVIKEAYLQIYA